MKPIDWKMALQELGACDEARNYYIYNFDDFEPRLAWESCPNPHWMQWLLSECYVLTNIGGRRAHGSTPWPTFERDLRLAACDVADEFFTSVVREQKLDSYLFERVLASTRLFALGERTFAQAHDTANEAFKEIKRNTEWTQFANISHYDSWNALPQLLTPQATTALHFSFRCCDDRNFEKYERLRKEHPICTIIRRHVRLEDVVDFLHRHYEYLERSKED